MSRIDDVLGYWFDQAGDDQVINPHHPCYQRWFKGGERIDKEIESEFRSDVEATRGGEYDDWEGKPRGALALTILLDQFPRQIYRGDALAFDSDAAGHALARRLIAQGADENYPLVERVFLYLPIQHSEAIRDHELAVERYMRLVILATERQLPISSFCHAALVSEIEHVDTLREFGRYCYRNPALGRTSTSGEEVYLAKRAAPPA